DFTEDEALSRLDEVLAGAPVDLVLSDMAPNMSGQTAVDQPRAMYLMELAADFAESVLRPGGDFLVKAFQGEGFDGYLRHLRGRFARVRSRKPKASRDRSREVYLLARQFQS
ncbi:MAG TPA: SAM-dependent methyltransferase, partial [Gammaproteobacteria bacterium]|nr:SAM-dependent methyltransferase [Gammaproteobacteria bacterium]